jgi:quercetin 2,3-dioxygenase
VTLPVERLPPGLEIRRAQDRDTTRTDWLDSRHSFSFGQHYDPRNTHHGLLLANNDDTVAPGTGFETHPHRDMEIVTWVLRGSLVHRDSTGRTGVIHPGLAQRMSAGSGIEHSERNDAHDPVRFVQMWVVPDESGGAPGYAQRDVEAELRPGVLVPVASGLDGQDSAVRIANQHAGLHAARLRPGRPAELPDAPFLHLFVACGEVELEGAGPLTEGDAVRFTGTGGQRVTARTPAEILVWEMHARIAT